ncbi:MAG: acyl-CoA dehydrogenase [Proteobacteria bacterium]|nr:acyl-CoA dehydrogenase [Pseudomonadota bacterium]
MGHYKINLKDVFFILKEQLDYGSLATLERYLGLNEKAFDMLVNEAASFAKGVVDPLQETGERSGITFENNKVSVPEEYRKAFRQYGEKGWIAVDLDEEYGGQAFPQLLTIVKNDFMYGACQAFNMAPGLTRGSAHLIESFAKTPLKKRFVPKMLEGIWAGTMCLTEPQAGSNLADITATAVRDGDHFRIKGEKIFISWGDHDMTENIIHLVLARIAGAPSGVKGISLFIVPKNNVDQNGMIEGPNDVFCSGIEEKMGIHASPTCSLVFGARDACVGYLCGEENKGLAHMFQMMNSARINTGVAGLGVASTAYQNALSYCRERVQGRDVARRKDGNVPIIDHPDVRRMLLWMKGMVDGMRSMVYSGMFWADMAKALPEGDDKKHYQDLTEFMTPIIKSCCSDMAFRVCETAVQCYGGYGFIREYPQEQYLRDVKILSLYEGTNGIQSMDLMGRKMTIEGGAPFEALKKEIQRFCDEKKDHAGLGDTIRAFEGVAGRLCDAAVFFREKMKTDPLQWASYTFPMLNAFSDTILVWRLLDMAVIAYENAQKPEKKYDFYRGKVMQATYLSDITLPHILVTIETCLRHNREIVDMPDAAF